MAEQFASGQMLHLHNKLRVAPLIEVLAVDLVDLGAKNYAAGLRMVIFTALNLLADLGGPGLATDIARVVDHCGLLIEELNQTAA